MDETAREAMRLLEAAGVIEAEPEAKSPDDERGILDTIDAPSVASVRTERVDWTWRGRIPRGKVSVLDGDPNLGKSTVTLDLAARLSTGSPFPDGDQPEAAAVVLMSAEDAVGDTIRPRLEAAGADLDRVHVFRGVQDGTSDEFRPPALPGDLPALEALVVGRGAALVVIDPLMAFLAGDVNSHRDQDIRRALHALSAVGERTDAAVVIIRHLNKAAGGNALYRGGGSIGIIGAARAGMLIAPDPSDEARRILAMTKSNLAAMPDALAYRLVPSEGNPDVARVKWEGPTKHTAGELLATPQTERESPKKDAAEKLLREMLADGPVLRNEIQEAAEDEDISWRTVKKAKSDLGVVSEQEYTPGKRGGGPSMWSLPIRCAKLGGQPPISNEIAHQISETKHQVRGHVSGPSGFGVQSENAVAHQTPDDLHEGPRATCETCEVDTFYYRDEALEHPVCAKCLRAS